MYVHTSNNLTSMIAVVSRRHKLHAMEYRNQLQDHRVCSLMPRIPFRDSRTTAQGLPVSLLRRLLSPPGPPGEDAALEAQLWSALPAGCRGAWQANAQRAGSTAAQARGMTRACMYQKPTAA